MREIDLGKVHRVTLVVSMGSGTGLGFPKESLIFTLSPSGSEGEDSLARHAVSARSMGFDKRGCRLERTFHPRPKPCNRNDVMWSSDTTCKAVSAQGSCSVVHSGLSIEVGLLIGKQDSDSQKNE